VGKRRPRRSPVESRHRQTRARAGGFLTAELEGNFGKGVNLRSGGLLPVNTNQIFPIPGEENLLLPALNITQFLSEYAGVVVGKLATTAGGDMNEFAHGKGDTQFMNFALNLNPALLLTVPYSTLGAGVIILLTKDFHAAIISFSVVSAVGVAVDVLMPQISMSGNDFRPFRRLAGNRLGSGLQQCFPPRQPDS
jgi:porin